MWEDVSALISCKSREMEKNSSCFGFGFWFGFFGFESIRHQSNGIRFDSIRFNVGNSTVTFVCIRWNLRYEISLLSTAQMIFSAIWNMNPFECGREYMCAACDLNERELRLISAINWRLDKVLKGLFSYWIFFVKFFLSIVN